MGDGLPLPRQSGSHLGSADHLGHAHDGALAGAVLVFYDITQRKRGEEAERHGVA
jgi:hypothetical protein